MRDNAMMCSIFFVAMFDVQRSMVERDVMGLASKLFQVVAVHSEISLVKLIDSLWLNMV
jgi:hypothetical protein